MKYLILTLALAASAFAQQTPTFTPAAKDGSNVNPATWKTVLSLSNVENTSLTSWTGSSSVTTLGTVTTGTWHGTSIADAYIASAATWNAKQAALTFGTGVQTALGVNVGSAGAPVLFNGAGGTPSSITLTNADGTAASLTAGTATVANGLKSATTTVAVSSATAPTAGQVLTATGTTAATWQSPRRYYKTICCVGTSITFAGNSITTTAGGPRENDSARGHSGWLRHLLGSNVIYPLRSDRGETVHNHGWSGWNVSGNGTQAGIVYGNNGYTPADDALKTDADLYILEGGTNDISNGYSNAVVIQNITDYWTKFRAAGRDVIAVNIPPRGSSAGTTVRDSIVTVNAALPAIATSLGVTLVDIYSLATLDGSGYATTASLWDGTHPGTAYAHKIASAIAAVIPSEKIPDLNIIPKATSAQWVTSSNSPSQATIPTGWTKLAATFTDTYSAVTDSDTTTWQRVTLTRTSGTSYSAIGFYNQVTTGFKAGDLMRASAKIRAATGTFDVGDFGFTVACYGSDGANVSTVALQGPGDTNPMDPITGTFTTPPFTVPFGTTAITWTLTFYGNNVTCDIREIGVFRETGSPADFSVAGLTTASRVVGSALSLTTATPATLTSISLTAGEWDISAVGGFTGTPTGGTECSLGIATTTNSFTGSVIGDSKVQTQIMPVSGIDTTQTIPSVRVSPTSTTVYYLVGQATFTGSTCSGYGRISARRIR